MRLFSFDKHMKSGFHIGCHSNDQLLSQHDTFQHSVPLRLHGLAHLQREGKFNTLCFTSNTYCSVYQSVTLYQYYIYFTSLMTALELHFP